MSEIDELKARVEELELKAEGKCPVCKRVIKGWKPVFGYFAPEWWATMRENGIDPGSGHTASCNNKSFKL